MKDIVAIIGSHPRTREQFDFSRTDCDAWLFNEAISNKTNTWATRADLVFQMHVPTIWRNPANRNDPHHYDWLKTQTESDVMMQDVFEDVPRSKKYPLEGVMDMLSGDPDHFLSSSVPQAIAYAIYLGIYKRIEIYGVAMETNTEWQFQREGVAFWKGFAMGRGIDVYFADPTFRCPLYGYEGDVTIKYERFGERIEELKPEIQKLSREYNAAALDLQKAVELLFDNGGKELEDALWACVERQLQLGGRLGLLDGARQENLRYQQKADKMREADGGNFIFSRQEFESALTALTKKAGETHTAFISIGTELGNLHNAMIQAAKGSPKRKKLVDAYIKSIPRYFQANNLMHVYKGAASENTLYMQWLDQHIRAAGGAKSEAVLLERLQHATAEP